MGQNFLQDEAVAKAIAEAAESTPDDTVVEIGPGLGAVTRHLAANASRRLLLIEKDAKLAAHQREVFEGDPRVEVIEADAADFDRRPLFKHGPLKVVGNLPYSVGTTILASWAETPSPVGRAVFMLQREVCERLTAAPRTGDYGQLTVRVQARWNVEIILRVGPEAFKPRPAVQSAVLVLTPRDRHEFPVFDEPLFTKLVRRGFSQRRKQLKNVLQDHVPDWSGLCAHLGVSETVRAEELDVARWIEIARYCDPHPLKDLPQSHDELFDVVDDHDQVIGQATRGEVHARALQHRAVHVFAFDRAGNLLLQKRSHLKDTCPGKWDSSAAGHLDAGESYDAAVLRELAEELGLTSLPEPPRRVARIAAAADTGWEFVELHAVSVRGKVHWPAAEVEAVTAFPLEEIDAWTAARPQDFAPGFLRCWEAFRRADGTEAESRG